MAIVNFICCLRLPNRSLTVCAVAHKAFKFYLRPTVEQAADLDRIRRTCCELYNAAPEKSRPLGRGVSHEAPAFVHVPIAQRRRNDKAAPPRGNYNAALDVQIIIPVLVRVPVAVVIARIAADRALRGPRRCRRSFEPAHTTPCPPRQTRQPRKSSAGLKVKPFAVTIERGFRSKDIPAATPHLTAATALARECSLTFALGLHLPENLLDRRFRAVFTAALRCDLFAVATAFFAW